ncbi:MAG: hypothetical protein KDD60_12020, partial [Bdellovibrionales bacterium]|nr:hypothetical protein [Bdellovibrionales bacterium]
GVCELAQGAKVLVFMMIALTVREVKLLVFVGCGSRHLAWVRCGLGDLAYTPLLLLDGLDQLWAEGVRQWVTCGQWV